MEIVKQLLFLIRRKGSFGKDTEFTQIPKDRNHILPVPCYKGREKSLLA